eukprot:TRINITY_DN6203_c0_g1_i1.p1 TRINITY_DN6203_c0_g1~~TRINITY_DN6203_c0_g1_i1.p1  ORF type:complete len:293 (-),score=22.46 TRINITY_DN6203_c0_g1_i1:979-1857(-)
MGTFVDRGDYLEAQLLTDPVSQADDESGPETGRIVYRASFEDLEHSHVNFETLYWFLISVVLILAYGVGLLMLLYIPVRRYVVRRDIRSRQLYVTSSALVYKVERPVFLPCLGKYKREKHFLLHLISDIVVEQGCLQSYFGITGVRIETAGQSRLAPGDEVRIQGISNPALFRQVVLMAATTLRQRDTDGGASSPKGDEMILVDDGGLRNSLPHSQLPGWSWPSTAAGVTSWQPGYSPVAVGPNESGSSTSSPKNSIYKKLEDIEKSLKVSINAFGCLSSSHTFALVRQNGC